MFSRVRQSVPFVEKCRAREFRGVLSAAFWGRDQPAFHDSLQHSSLGCFTEGHYGGVVFQVRSFAEARGRPCGRGGKSSAGARVQCEIRVSAFGNRGITERHGQNAPGRAGIESSALGD